MESKSTYPVNTEVVEHVRCEERESEAEEGSQDTVASQNGCSEDSICVDQAAHNAMSQSFFRSQVCV